MKRNYTALPHPELLERVQAIVPSETPIYLVGGAVRDMLLGQTSYDLDFVVPRDAIPISRRVANALGGAFYKLDPERDTGRVVLTVEGKKRLLLDFASLRAPDLENDLRERDFTINAIAIDLRAPDHLIDPLGGVQDLHDKTLRACSGSAFQRDALRILRSARLAVAFNLQITAETKKLIREALTTLPRVSPERLRDELFRILDGPQPATCLRILDALGALSYALPELPKLKGFMQPPPHTLDVWTHTLKTIEELTRVLNLLAPQYDTEAAGNWALGLISLRIGRYREKLHEHLSQEIVPDRSLRALLMFAALYHDVGKPLTSSTDPHGRIRFLNHEKVGEQIVRERARFLQLSNAEIGRVSVVVRHHMRPLFLAQAKGQPTKRAIYRFFRDRAQAGVDICLLSMADVLATYHYSPPEEAWTRHLEVIRQLLEAWWEHFTETISPPPLINGDDLIQVFQLKPSPLIGQLLQGLKEAQAEGRIQNREQALEFARSWLEEQVDQG